MGKDKTTTSAKTPKTVATEPAMIIFGRDESGKPHASWFAGVDTELAEKAAGLMKMKALRVVADDHRAIALQLPVGRVFASGKGFVPFAKEAVYERLSGLDGAFDPPPPEPPAAPEPLPPILNMPIIAADVTGGSLVLASTGPREGWFESVVVEAKADALFVLRWRDFPDDASFVRRGEDLAFLNPATVQAGP